LATTTTGSSLALSGFADFAFGASHSRTTVDALPHTAELIFPAGYAFADIDDALFVPAQLANGTFSARLGTISNDTTSSAAGFSTGTFGFARLRHTNVVDTNLASEALAIAALGLTDAFGTLSATFVFGNVIVNLTVAIVVEAVANFSRWLTSRTSVPITLGTSLGTFTTSRLALAEHTFVNPTVAVVVSSVTDFVFGGRRSAARPFTCFASLFTATTVILTRALQTIVNNAIAIVVFVVAGFFFGCGVGRASAPLSVVTHLIALAARTGACTTHAIDFPVAVIVEIVADFFGRGVCDILHRFLQLRKVVGLVVLTRTSQRCTTCDCHVIEA
jgi:hypothetical protein